MNIEKRRAEIAARKAEIRKLLTDDKNADIDALEKELRELNEEDAGLEKRQAIERMLNSGSAMGNPIENPVAARSLPVEDTEKLYRSAWLKTLQGKSLTDDEKRVYEQRAYSTAANSALPIIPETTANQIIKKMYEVAPILQRCKIFHVPGNFKFAVEGTNSDAALHTENASITAASDSLTSVSLTGYEIVKLVKASRASSEMALSAFESYIVEVIAESIARKIENYIFTGTGSDQPGGVKVAGKGTSGAYTDGTDQVTVAKTASLTEENVVSLYGMLASGYERNAVWCMNKATFFTDFFPLMNKSKNNLIEFAGGKYYIMGAEVYFTGSLAAHEAYYGDFEYIIGNYSQDITVVRSEHSGLATNSIDYLGACVFDCKPVAGLGAFPFENAPGPFDGHTLLVQQGTNAPEHDEVRIGIQPLPFRRTQGAQLLEFRFPETQYVTFQLQQPSRFPDAIRPSSHRVPMRNASCSIDYRQKDMPRHRCVAIRCGRPDS